MLGYKILDQDKGRGMIKIKKQPIRKSEIAIVGNSRIDALYKNIAGYIREARSRVLQKVNTEQVRTYWLIGRDIVEEEQAGKGRAEYGAFLLKELSIRLTKEFGNGFGRTTIADIRQFYLTYQKVHALRGLSTPDFKDNLGWIHYRAIMREERVEVRSLFTAHQNLMSFVQI